MQPNVSAAYTKNRMYGVQSEKSLTSPSDTKQLVRREERRAGGNVAAWNPSEYGSDTDRYESILLGEKSTA